MLYAFVRDLRFHAVAVSGWASTLTVAGIGISSYLFYFKQGEHHLHPLRYLLTAAAIYSLGAFVLICFNQVPTPGALIICAKYLVYYLASLLSSVLVYRLFFNPLNKFPGPYWARLSKFWHVIAIGTRRQNHYLLLRLHEQYGPFVRIGPNDISITDPTAGHVTTSHNTKCKRGPFYSLDHPSRSLHFTRNRDEHSSRRRIWSRAFSDVALRDYEIRIEQYEDALLDKISERLGQRVNVTKWFNIYTFDVMGELGFAKSFGMIRSEEMHPTLRLLPESTAALGFNFPTWFTRLLISTPGLRRGYESFRSFFTKELQDRMARHGKIDARDISGTLIDHHQSLNLDKQKDDFTILLADIRLIIVAGSETTSSTLIHLFYYLAKDPILVQNIREEIDSLIHDSKFKNADLRKCQFLDGCIKEALRLHPPVPSGSQEKIPEEGLRISDRWIPGNTIIQTPWYAMGRDPSLFPQPESFIPGRHYSQPELMPVSEAWAPFNTGQYACIGRNLAFLELRRLTAAILSKFNVSMAPGEDGKALIQNSKDCFTLHPSDLHLVFSRRH